MSVSSSFKIVEEQEPEGHPDDSNKEADKERERLAGLGWPPFLLKSVGDPFDYVAFVRGVGLVRFEYAEPVSPEWVRLRPHQYHDMQSPGLRYPCPRGLEVRVADLVYVADAPEGS